MTTPRKAVDSVSGPAKNVRSAYCDAPMMLFKDKFNLCSRCHEWHGIKYEAETQSSDKVQQGVAEPVREEKAYKPRVGDRISLQAEVVDSNYPGWYVRFDGGDEQFFYCVSKEEMQRAKLLSRKTRTLTKAEAEEILGEKLNEQITIE